MVDNNPNNEKKLSQDNYTNFYDLKNIEKKRFDSTFSIAGKVFDYIYNRYNNLKSTNITLLILSLDYTYTNNELGHDGTDKLATLLESHFDKEYGKFIIVKNKLGSKFIYVLKQKIEKEELKNIKKGITWCYDNIKIKQFDNLSIKQGYIVNHEPKVIKDVLIFSQDNFYSIGEDYNIDIIYRFFSKVEYLFIKKRESIQKYIKDEEKSFISTKEYIDLIDLLGENYPKFINEFKLLDLKSVSKIDIDQKFIIKQSKFFKFIDKNYKKYKLSIIKKNKESTIYNNKKEILKELFSYYLFVKLQRLLFKLYKFEKIKSLVKIKKDKNGNIKDVELQIKNYYGLLRWFKSIMLPALPFINDELKITVNEILQLIQKIKFKAENYKSIEENLKKLSLKIIEFENNYDELGIQGTTISQLEIKENTREFIINQIVLNRLSKINKFSIKEHQRYKYKLTIRNDKLDRLNLLNKLSNSRYIFEEYQKFLNFNFVKPKFPVVANYGLHNFYNFTRFIGGLDLIDKKYNKNYEMSLVFIEMDGFNAFNHYIFPDYYDSIYSDICNLIYSTAKKYFNTSQLNNDSNKEDLNIFRNMSFQILGDEFFGCFIYEKKYSEKAKKMLEFFVEDFTKVSLDILQSLVFRKSEKINIKTNSNEIIIRASIIDDEQINRNNNINKLMFTPAKITYSRAIVYGKSIDISNFESDLEEMLDISEYLVDKIKNKGGNRFAKAKYSYFASIIAKHKALYLKDSKKHKNKTTNKNNQKGNKSKIIDLKEFKNRNKT